MDGGAEGSKDSSTKTQGKQSKSQQQQQWQQARCPQQQQWQQGIQQSQQRWQPGSKQQSWQVQQTKESKKAGKTSPEDSNSNTIPKKVGVLQGQRQGQGQRQATTGVAKKVQYPLSVYLHLYREKDLTTQVLLTAFQQQLAVDVAPGKLQQFVHSLQRARTHAHAWLSKRSQKSVLDTSVSSPLGYLTGNHSPKHHLIPQSVWSSVLQTCTIPQRFGMRRLHSVHTVGLDHICIPEYVHTYLSRGNKYIPSLGKQTLTEFSQHISRFVHSVSCKLALQNVESKSSTAVLPSLALRTTQSPGRFRATHSPGRSRTTQPPGRSRTTQSPGQFSSSWQPRLPIQQSVALQQFQDTAVAEATTMLRQRHREVNLLAKHARAWLKKHHQNKTLVRITGDKNYGPASVSQQLVKEQYQKLEQSGAYQVATWEGFIQNFWHVEGRLNLLLEKGMLCNFIDRKTAAFCRSRLSLNTASGQITKLKHRILPLLAKCRWLIKLHKEPHEWRLIENDAGSPLAPVAKLLEKVLFAIAAEFDTSLRDSKSLLAALANFDGTQIFDPPEGSELFLWTCDIN